LPLALLLAVAIDAGTGATASAATSPGFQLGVFVPDAGPGLAAFESEIGRKTDSFLWYQAIGENLDTADLAPIAQSGHTIQLAWEPQDPNASDPVNQPAYQLRDITAGNYDADIHRWAQQLRDFGYPVIFRPMCEMNGDWTPWSGTVNGNSPQDYIPAWRHIHDIFAQEGAANVKWVWAPNQDNTTAGATSTFDTYYPGDAYVDYVGINGYNWGTMYQTPDWSSQWMSFTDTFAPTYDVAVARTSKPVIICETASTEQGGDKAQWISDMFARLPSRFPRIVGVTWFNINKETDWRVESSAASLAAFRAAVAPADTTPPAVSFAAPADGADVSGAVGVTVSASDNVGVTRVELYAGGSLVGSATAAPYDFNLDTRGLAGGAATLTAKAYDAAGNSSTSQINLNVKNSSDRSYYFGWYDDASSGMQCWVVIGNPGPAAQHAQVYIGGRLSGEYDIGPGQRVTPMFAGVMNGPVKVVSTTGGGLLVSERSLYNGSFTELPAAPASGPATDYYLTWYDQRSPGMASWVIIGNQGNADAQVDVTIAGQEQGHYTVPAGGRVTPQFNGVINGPVRVTCSNGQPLTVSERTVFDAAFNETLARTAQSLTAENDFTWYDDASPGMSSWALVANPSGQAAMVDVYVAGRLMGNYNIPAGGRITPSYPGTVDGPVRVVATGGQPLIASQRTLFKAGFAEVTGTSPARQSSDQWFAWYDSGTPGMLTWLLVGNQGQAETAVDVRIAGSIVGHYTIPAGGRITPVFSGQVNGPVEVTGSAGSSLITSERVIYYGSFDEVAGRALP
jgi:beta-mannanase